MSTRIEGIVDKVSDAEQFSTVEWVLGKGPITNFVQSTVDSKIKANLEFQGKAGLPAKVVRKSRGYCCEWCNNLIGEYDYPDVPPDVYRRHDNCNCIVTYYPGDGRKQNVHTKAWEVEEPEVLEERKTVGLVDAPTGAEREILATAMQDADDAKAPKEFVGDFEQFEELDLTEQEKALSEELLEMSKADDNEHGFVIAENGDIRPCNGEHGRVKMPIFETDGDNVTLLHSHTSEALPSVADLVRMSYKRVSKSVVITINGDTFTIERGYGILPTEDEIRKVVFEIDTEVSKDLTMWPGFYDYTYEEKQYLLLRESFIRVCRHFEWTITGGKI